MTKPFAVTLVFCAFAAVLTLGWMAPERMPEDPTAGASYVGAKSCKKCHFKQHRSWKKMKHAGAYEALPEKHRDPKEMDDKGRACISCHTTGYGDEAASGFIDAEQSDHLLGVQCESCHGPGSKHNAAGQVLLDEKRKTFHEGEATFTILRTTKCADCHNPHMSFKKIMEDI